MTPAQKRAAAVQAHDVYLATIESLEPDIGMIDASAFYASAAISLKRIADALESRVRTSQIVFHNKAGHSFVADYLADNPAGVPMYTERK